MDKSIVPIAVIKRMPRYFRYLSELMKNNVEKVSSQELSRRMNVTASQIRQDFNSFGGFGQQGYGYNVRSLYNEIGTILGYDLGLTAIIIGIGNLGNAITHNINFEKRGVKLIGLFDISPSIVGTTYNNIEVLHVDSLDEFCKEKKPDIAVLTLPKPQTPPMCKHLAELGVKGFWNFSNMEITDIEGVSIENVHLGDSLMTLCFDIKSRL